MGMGIHRPICMYICTRLYMCQFTYKLTYAGGVRFILSSVAQPPAHFDTYPPPALPMLSQGQGAEKEGEGKEEARGKVGH